MEVVGAILCFWFLENIWIWIVWNKCSIYVDRKFLLLFKIILYFSYIFQIYFDTVVHHLPSVFCLLREKLVPIEWNLIYRRYLMMRKSGSGKQFFQPHDCSIIVCKVKLDKINQELFLRCALVWLLIPKLRSCRYRRLATCCFDLGQPCNSSAGERWVVAWGVAR